MRLVREPLEAAMQGLVENLWVFLWWNQESARKNGKEQGDQKGPVKMYFKSKDFDGALLWKIINIGGSKFRRPETLILSHPKPMALGHSLVIWQFAIGNQHVQKRYINHHRILLMTSLEGRKKTLIPKRSTCFFVNPHAVRTTQSHRQVTRCKDLGNVTVPSGYLLVYGLGASLSDASCYENPEELLIRQDEWVFFFAPQFDDGFIGYDM